MHKIKDSKERYVISTCEVDRSSAKWVKGTLQKIKTDPGSVIYPITTRNVVEKGE
ncbi:hypothetical protein [Virgibacillus sp. L01]|uniref:hypothetical protein n=1 Tax=Virgibacillus sp. L01 TaxID=3457429 RepID=UPI003FD42796